MKGTLITIGIILVVLGLIGLAASYYTSWMWVVIIVGIVGIVWGAMYKKGTPMQ
jgi:1,4-dihydroxy-2-naphthoate octaprenyltransferase